MNSLLLSLLATIIFWTSYPAVALDFPLSESTETGIYRISISPKDNEVQLGKAQNWTVTIRDKDDQVFIPSQLVIYGGMPSHKHGLPSTPSVTERSSADTYLIEGLRFNMYGEWQLIIGVTGPLGPDKAEFNFVLQPKLDSDQLDLGEWTESEWTTMQSMALQSAIGRTIDPSNRFDGNPIAADLGKTLFFDPVLSKSDDIACATCHRPEINFTDGIELSKGSKMLTRNSPTIIGVARHEWFYWDGRRDSLWSQSLVPIETTGEMDATRVLVISRLLAHKEYRERLESLLGYELGPPNLPISAGPYGNASEKSAWADLSGQSKTKINRIFSDVGKILASYISTLDYKPSRFDKYVSALQSGYPDLASTLLNKTERVGLRLYLDTQKTACLRCHNGPYLTNFAFHNIGTALSPTGRYDFGRLFGVRSARVDEFNCMSSFNDDAAPDCSKYEHALAGHSNNGAFKVPSLRGISVTAPYMHDGRFSNIQEVLEFYKAPPPQEDIAHEIPPLNLSDHELAALEEFLKTL